MRFSAWLKHPIKSFKAWRQKRKRSQVELSTHEPPPLREFVYLDEVSLHSLLVSQTSTIPYEISHAMTLANEAEVSASTGGSASAGPPIIQASTQSSVTGRYQTSNSNSTQSSRKAVVQTLFKELRELPLDFKFSEQNGVPQNVHSFETAREVVEQAHSEPAHELTRGTLIEIEVCLAVDPVFKLSTMMAEYTGMADDFPGMFQEPGYLDFLNGSQPMLKVLDRFLAGLIPIRATAVNYVVIEVDNQEYVVHKDALTGLDVESKPLRIVGVTEHVGYWKDTRRVLFSDAKFTVLCRIARDGLQTIWSPVKIADLFADVAPDFVHEINAIRFSSAEMGPSSEEPAAPNLLSVALQHYKLQLVATNEEWSVDSESEFRSLSDRVAFGPHDAISQRNAFDLVRDLVVDELKISKPSPDDDLQHRRLAREAAGLSLFPSHNLEPNFEPKETSATSILPSADNSQPTSTFKDDERLLDTEVIAIYW